VRVSKTLFQPGSPYWQDYLPFLQRLTGRGFPTCDQLNALLPDGLRSESGQNIQFVPSTELDDGAYEYRIYTTGQVSTRPDNWHDLFNALVWMRFPRIKIAMNTLHFHAYSEQVAGSRGPLRDALTLFDECGVIVFSNHLDKLNSLAERRWAEVFQTDAFSNGMNLVICGHAMLEKYLSPYKSMTAKALLVHLSKDIRETNREEQLAHLDMVIADRLLLDELLTQPANLTPLPLAGVSGWWPNGQQDDDFYADPQVFRPPPSGLAPAPVFSL